MRAWVADRTRSACFTRSLRDAGVKMVGVEAGGRGNGPRRACGAARRVARLRGARPGVLQGTYTYVLQNADGQISTTHSVSAGLDYPAVGPEHAWLAEKKRAEYSAVSDDSRHRRGAHCSPATKELFPRSNPRTRSPDCLQRAPKMSKDRNRHPQSFRTRRQGHGHLLPPCSDLYRLAATRVFDIRVQSESERRKTVSPANSTTHRATIRRLARGGRTRHRGVHHGRRSRRSMRREISFLRCRSGRGRHRAGRSVQRSGRRWADDSARQRTRLAKPARLWRACSTWCAHPPVEFGCERNAAGSFRLLQSYPADGPRKIRRRPRSLSRASTACSPPISRRKNPSNIAAFIAAHNLDTIFLAAPTSTDERLKIISLQPPASSTSSHAPA